MKVLVAPWGRRFGHTSRAAAIVEELLGLKHDASILSMPYAPRLGNGVDESLPITQSVRAIPASDPWDVWRKEGDFREAVDADLQLLEREQPDALIIDGRFSLTLAAEFLGIPYVSLVQECCLPHQRYHAEDRYWEAMLEPSQRQARRLGVESPADDIRELFVRGGVVVPSHPSVDEIPAGYRPLFVGPLNWRPSGDEQCPVELAPTDVIVYGAAQTADDLNSLMRAYAHTGLRIVVAAPELEVARAIRDADASAVISVPLLDLDEAAAKVAHVITHGGHGTVLTCIRANVPFAVLPNLGQLEQQSTGQHIAEMKLGLMLDDRRLWNQLPGAMSAHAADRQIREKRSEVSNELRSLGAAGAVVDMLQTYSSHADLVSWR